VLVVICGSAASWMIDHIINNRGGLYQRVTRKLNLKPFSLAEVAEYLKSRSVRYEPRQIAELYMALGGIPHYLREVRSGLSAAQNIEQICFNPQGILVDEYTSGGRLTKTIEELMVSGFIERVEPWGKESRDASYRLIDEFSLFYLKWMKRRSRSSKATWLDKRGTPAWYAWSGFAFENICHRHIAEIKRELGIASVETQHGCWQYRPKSTTQQGAQIDFLIDRRDDVINLCEIKYADDQFVIDQKYAKQLRQKIDVFRQATKTRKTVHLTMITTFGVKQNQYSSDLVDSQVILSGLVR
jgi:hypothetical protein